MKRFMRLLRGQLGISQLLLSEIAYLTVAIVVNASVHLMGISDASPRGSFLGGLPQSIGANGINYLAYARWILIVEFPLVTVSLFAEQVKRMFTMTLLRIGNSWQVWGGACLTAVFHVALHVSTLYLVTWVVSEVYLTNEILISLMLIYVHSCLLSILAMLSIGIYVNRIAPILFIILMESVSFSIAQRFRSISSVMPGTWSMFYQSNCVSDTGFSAVIVTIVGLATILLCLYIAVKKSTHCSTQR